ncbi:MAG: alpha-amylase, partial [Candidatus Cloacimonadota bacterium]
MIQFDFHVSKVARQKYDFNQSLFSITGNLIIANFSQARLLSDKINRKRKSAGLVDQLVTPGELNALGLLHEVFHFLIRKYEIDENPGAFKRANSFLKNDLGEKDLSKILISFVEEFPPLPVFKKEVTAKKYLSGLTGGKPNTEIILEELILLHLENRNPAASRLKEFFSDEGLHKETKYKELIEKTEKFFDKEKPTGIGGIHLFSLLQKPVIDNPSSLEEQLKFIRNEWKIFIGDKFFTRLLKGADLIKEEYKLFVKHGGGEKATPPVPVYPSPHQLKMKGRDHKIITDEGSDLDFEEAEQFTQDTHWIPEVVMIAKNIFVWMHQLTEKYGFEIKTLDQIPDEELDLLAQWNFTALWLIGIWERSSASQKIKQQTGNPQAAASAYSLFDYVIAEEIGGEGAFQNLKERAWQRGIRLASDMVPNHTGIYSKWIVEKPDYFIQSADPPFPSYKFTGTNLSDDDRVEVRIEDSYYNRSDAAVVFERRDAYTGDKRYIYHGNDGTHMPWNDTAQLNVLNNEVKESLIQTIIHVAHKTPIIRFDAAMTLAKKHYQRLWFPKPGEGGAIPSRSDFAMTTTQFNALMPNEFWREVVDRVGEALPGTLLLAEAFWLMESYFVRTLGMHRVYNSAFMHMMMKEENEKYKDLLKNTLEYNPEILKRYVNFMSNPDEETAVNQFGKGDKYFGVAVMMVTLPGLPMFGHGQVEGFSEKYGMEYKQAYYDEPVDEHLAWRHKKELFPLLKMRHLFSQAENFELYDFIDGDNEVNNNVFAFSNKVDSEIALVLYNNSYSQASGSIRFSCLKASVNNKSGSTNPRKISNVLGFKPLSGYFYIYTDHRTQLQYLISGKEISKNGFNIHLFGYQYRICYNFVEIYDASGRYMHLYNHLNGKGVSSVEEAIKEMDLIPFHSSIEVLFSLDNLAKFRNYLLTSSNSKKKKQDEIKIPPAIITGFENVVDQISTTADLKIDSEKRLEKFTSAMITTRSFCKFWTRINKRKNVAKWMQEANLILPVNDQLSFGTALLLLFLYIALSHSIPKKKATKIVVNEIFNEMMLSKVVNNLLSNLDEDENYH